MKIPAFLLTLAALAAATHHAAAQGGSLTPPPGVPAPTMKSLDQVEARTPLVAGQPGVSIDANGTITISQPGSYYLTKNLTITTASAHGIAIGSDDVTLDLNGFALICTTVNGGNAVSLTSNRRGITIRNGRILGGSTQTSGTFTLAGWDRGVSGSMVPGATGRVSDVSVRGVRTDGITMGANTSSAVERCMVDTCGDVGIEAGSVLDCSVRNSGNTAILIPTTISAGIVSRSYGECVGASGSGIIGLGAVMENSRGIAVGGYGIHAFTATNSSGESSSSYGLSVENANNCVGESNSGIGLRAQCATNCLGFCDTGSFGMEISGTASFCRGSRPGGIAISAPIAIGCTAITGGGTITSAQKHLGTP